MIRVQAKIPLNEALAAVDRVLSGETVVLDVPADSNAEGLAAALIEFGLVVHLVD